MEQDVTIMCRTACVANTGTKCILQVLVVDAFMGDAFMGDALVLVGRRRATTKTHASHLCDAIIVGEKRADRRFHPAIGIFHMSVRKKATHECMLLPRTGAATAPNG